MKHLKHKFKNEYRDKSYLEIYSGWFYILTFVGFLCLMYSAVSSLKYWEYHILPDWLGDAKIYAAGALSIFVAILLALTSDHCIKLWKKYKDLDFILILCVTLFLFNAYTDWIGSPEIANTIHASPTDNESEAHRNNSEQLQKRIDAIYWHYRWCGVHNAKHADNSCKSLYVPKSKGELKDRYAKSGYTPKEDRAAIAKLEEERQLALDALSTSQTQYNKKLSTYESRMETTKKQLRGGVVVAQVIFLLISFWKHSFGYKVANEGDSENPKRNALQIENEINKFWTDLLNENDQLREEIRARDENNRKDDDFLVNSADGNSTHSPALNIHANGYAVTCEACGVETVKHAKHARFCSAKCRMNYHKELQQ